MTSSARRVMGIAISSGRIGFAYLVDGELMDWGLSLRSSRSFDAAFSRVLNWLIYYHPEVLVAEDLSASRKGDQAHTILMAVESAANNAGVAFVTLERFVEGPNKFVAAARLAEEFPQIGAWLPNPRRAWEHEPRNIIYFEALGLARDWWRTNEEAAGELPSFNTE